MNTGSIKGSKRFPLIRKLLLASVALMGCAGSAHAQLVSNRVVVFGDSLSDNGNLFKISGQPPAPYNQRFSNGLVWAEYFAGSLATSGANSLVGGQPLPSGNLDFAFGGARTDGLPVSATNPPGIQTQINGFAALGGTFKPTDIATVWGGANDIFQGLPLAASNPATATTVLGGIATTAGNNIGAEVKQLISLGAKTIIVNNLPNFSALPQFAGGPAAQLAGFGSSTFNASLATNLGAVAAANPGVNIITVDTAKAFSAIVSNPGAFGLTNTTQACITVMACVTGGAAVQNQYFFWDSVHPTDAVYRVISYVVYNYLTAGQSASAASAFTEIGFDGRRSALIGAFEQFGNIKKTGDKPEFFISAIGETLNRSSSSNLAGFNSINGGLRFGAVRSINEEWKAGVSFTAVTGSAKTGSINVDPTQIGADVLIGWNRGPYFINADLGAGSLNFNQYERSLIGLPWKNTANARGYTASLSTEAGIHYNFGQFEITPQARLAYIYANVAGFSEIGNAANVAISSRSSSGLTGALELKAATQITQTMKLNAIIGYEGVLTGSSDAFRAQLINNSAQPYVTSVAKPQSAGFLYGVGLQAKISENVTLGANYRGSASSGSIQNQGNITLNAKF